MEKIDEKALRIFYDDFRRALLMHRKGRLHFYSTLLFPNNESPLESEVPLLEQLDFRLWLGANPVTLEIQHQLYTKLSHRLDTLLMLVTAALESAQKNNFTSDQFDTIAQLMTDIDGFANRLVTSLTTSLTDVVNRPGFSRHS